MSRVFFLRFFKFQLRYTVNSTWIGLMFFFYMYSVLLQDRSELFLDYFEVILLMYLGIQLENRERDGLFRVYRN